MKRAPARGPLPLRELRELAGKTQGDVARVLGTNQAAVSRLERRRNVEIDTLATYAQAIGYRVEVLFTGHGRPPVLYELMRAPRPRRTVKRR